MAHYRSQCTLLLACSLAFGADARAEESTRSLDPAVAAIIAAPLSDADYVDARSCIDQRAFDDVEVLDDGRLLFHGRRGQAWLNQLRHRCIGLSPDSQLMFELRGSRYCQLDTFCARRSSFDRMALDVDAICTSQGLGICHLGRFEPISEAQASFMRESTEGYRRAGVRPTSGSTKRDAETNKDVDEE